MQNEFKQYQHIERWGTSETKGLDLGECYIFPKIDGTNASIFLKDGKLCAGSRKRELTLEQDNAGFFQYVSDNKKYLEFLNKYKNLRLFGEFLVPHSLKTYRDDAWRKFYVFDVCEFSNEEYEKYLHYNDYIKLLEEFDIDYIPCMSIIKNPTYESLAIELDKNTFLIKDGQGVGEGIVIKNYDYVNKYGRVTWGKIVTNEFKDKHSKAMGAPIITCSKLIEEQIVNDFCTKDFINKEFAKMTINDDWTSKRIPELLNRVFYTLIQEETYNIIKKHKMPEINFKTLNSLVTRKVKEIKSELF